MVALLKIAPLYFRGEENLLGTLKISKRKKKEKTMEKKYNASGNNASKMV